MASLSEAQKLPTRRGQEPPHNLIPTSVAAPLVFMYLLGVCMDVKVKKTFWLREFACMLKGENGDISQVVKMLESDGQFTMHLVTQLMRMYLMKSA